MGVGTRQSQRPLPLGIHGVTLTEVVMSKCACGCGNETNVDSRGRSRKWIHGHYIINNQKHLRENRTDGLQVCTKCNELKKLELFGFSKNTKNGRGSWCLKCGQKSSSEWRSRNRKRVNANLQKSRVNKYGIKWSDYLSMLERQDGKCKICGSIFSDKVKRRLAIDHCHKTNKVRGLLCFNCNAGIGFFKDDAYLMLKAIEYLREK